MQENKMERTAVVGEVRTSSLSRICGAGGMAKQHAAEWPEQTSVGEVRTSSLSQMCGGGGMAKQHAAEWPEQTSVGVFSVTR